jgi:hypothetical protein
MMWARVKGKTENDLLKLPFKAAYMFRPAAIQPLHGVRSKTAWVHAAYAATAPLWALLNRIAPAYATTTEKVGRAMIKVARDGYRKTVLESEDINGIMAQTPEDFFESAPTFAECQMKKVTDTPSPL